MSGETTGPVGAASTLPPITGHVTLDAIIYGVFMLIATTALFGAMGGGE